MFSDNKVSVLLRPSTLFNVPQIPLAWLVDVSKVRLEERPHVVECCGAVKVTLHEPVRVMFSVSRTNPIDRISLVTIFLSPINKKM